MTHPIDAGTAFNLPPLLPVAMTANYGGVAGK